MVDIGGGCPAMDAPPEVSPQVRERVVHPGAWNTREGALSRGNEVFGPVESGRSLLTSVGGGDLSSSRGGELLHHDLGRCRDRHADNRPDHAEE